MEPWLGSSVICSESIWRLGWLTENNKSGVYLLWYSDKLLGDEKGERGEL